MIYLKYCFCISFSWFTKEITNIDKNPSSSDFIDLKLYGTWNIDFQIIFNHKVSSITSIYIEESRNLLLKQNNSIKCFIQNRIKLHKMPLKIHIFSSSLILSTLEACSNLVNIFVSKCWYLCF
jgi:hypothetical protein